MKRKLLPALLCMLLLLSCLSPVTVLAEATELDPANAPLKDGTDLENGSIYTELGSIFAGIRVYQLHNDIPLTLTGY